MAYKRYRNLGELLQSDLSKKLNKDLVSLDYMERPCNCPAHCRINDKCPYGNKCRATCVVYKVKCNTRGKFYIGNTQQPLKKRMGGHYADVLRLVKILHPMAREPSISPKILRDKKLCTVHERTYYNTQKHVRNPEPTNQQ